MILQGSKKGEGRIYYELKFLIFMLLVCNINE